MTKIECHRNTVQQVINKMEREHSKSSCSQSIYKFNKKVGTPEVGNGNQLQYSCLENSMDSGAWQTSPWDCKELDMIKQLSTRHNDVSLDDGNLGLGM